MRESGAGPEGTEKMGKANGPTSISQLDEDDLSGGTNHLRRNAELNGRGRKSLL